MRAMSARTPRRAATPRAAGAGPGRAAGPRAPLPARPGAPKPAPIRATTPEEAATDTKATPVESRFDWRACWYPVAYAADVASTPLRVELFDEPFAVARTPAGGWLAFADACPHRGAALSEGRVTACGKLMCPYHGYTFSATGACVAAPYAPRAVGSPRAAASAVPVVEAQGIVWLAPAPGGPPPLLSALPLLPELELPGWVASDFVRDAPGVDAGALLANVADPDHGLFAHQTSNFDTFTASPDAPMTVRTDAATGAVAGETASRGTLLPTTTPSRGPSIARLRYLPPIHTRWSTHGGAKGEEDASFVAAFYVSPLAVGRSRLFVRYARSIAPWLPVPRWLLAMGLNGFVDQDTFLLATQSATALAREAEALACGSPPPRSPCPKSPTEAFLAAVEAWWVPKVGSQPGRAVRLARGAPLLPPRAVVLDRYATHTAIVPSSAAAWGVARRVDAAATAAAAAAAALLLGAAGSGAPPDRLAPWLVAPVAAAVVAAGARGVAARFEYRYDRSRQAADLARLATLQPGVEAAEE